MQNLRGLSIPASTVNSADMPSVLSQFSGAIGSTFRDFFRSFHFPSADPLFFLNPAAAFWGHGYKVIKEAEKALQSVTRSFFGFARSVENQLEQRAHAAEVITSAALLYFAIRDLRSQLRNQLTPEINRALEDSDPEKCKEFEDLVLLHLRDLGLDAEVGQRVYLVNLDSKSSYQDTRVWIQKNDRGDKACYIDAKLAASYSLNSTSSSQLKGLMHRDFSFTSKCKRYMQYAIVTITALNVLKNMNSLLQPASVLVDRLLPKSCSFVLNPVFYLTEKVETLFTLTYVPSLAVYLSKQLFFSLCDILLLKEELSHCTDDELREILLNYEQKLENDKKARADVNSSYQDRSIILHNAKEALRYHWECLKAIPRGITAGLQGVRREWEQIPTQYRSTESLNSYVYEEVTAVNAFIRSYWYTESGWAWMVDWGPQSDRGRMNMAKSILAQRG